MPLVPSTASTQAGSSSSIVSSDSAGALDPRSSHGTTIADRPLTINGATNADRSGPLSSDRRSHGGRGSSSGSAGVLDLRGDKKIRD